MKKSSKILSTVKAKKFKTSPIYVPEWDETVYFRELSAAESLRLEEVEKLSHRGLAGLRMSIVDEEGNQLFTEDEFAEVLASTSQGALVSLIASFAEFQKSLSDVESSKEVFTGSQS